MTEESLRAKITGTETLSNVMRDVSGAVRDAADAAEQASVDMSGFAGMMDAVEDSTADLNQTLAPLAGALEGIEQSVEGATSAMASAVGPATSYRDALDDLPGDALEAVAGNHTLARSLDDVADEARDAARNVTAVQAAVGALAGTTATASIATNAPDSPLGNIDNVATSVDAAVDVDANGLRRANLMADGLGESLSGLDDLNLPDLSLGASADTEAMQRNIADVRQSLSSLPDIRIDAATDASDLVDTLDSARDEALGAVGSLRELDGVTDDVIASADGIDDLTVRLDALDPPTNELRNLSSAAEDLLDDSVAGASGVETLESAVSDVGTEALTTAGELEVLEDQMGETVGEAIAGASSISVLTNSVDELGDEASESAVELSGLAGAMGFSSVASGLSANVGGLSGSLSTLAKLAPAAAAGLSSVASAAAGGIFGGGVALGGLGGLLGGGALAIGESIASEDAFDDIESASEGLEEYWSRLREQASTILEPLKSAENAELFSDVMQGGLSVLEDAVTLTTRLSDTLHDVADAVGGAWNNVSPEVFAELENAARAVLPALENLSVDVLSGLPGFISFTVGEFEQLAPLVGDVVDVATDLAPTLAELGTAGLSAALVVLEGIGYALKGLAPLADAAVPALEGLANIGSELLDSGLGDALTILGSLAGGMFVAVKAVGGLSAVMGALSTVGGVLSGVLSGGVLSAVVSLAGTIATLINPVTAVVAIGAGLITVLDGWDEVFGALATTWNYAVEYFEYLLNLASIAYGIFTAVADGVVKLVSPFESVGEVLDYVVGGLTDVIKGIVAVAKATGKYLKPIAETFGLLDDKVGDMGGVSLDEYKVGDDRPKPPSPSPPGGGPTTAPGAPKPAATGAAASQYSPVSQYQGSLPSASGQEGSSSSPYAGSSTQEVTNHYHFEPTIEGGSGSTEAELRRLFDEWMTETKQRQGTGNY